MPYAYQYVYIYIYIYVYVYIYIYVSSYVYVQIHMSTSIYIYIHIYTCIHIQFIYFGRMFFTPVPASRHHSDAAVEDLCLATSRATPKHLQVLFPFMENDVDVCKEYTYIYTYIYVIHNTGVYVHIYIYIHRFCRCSFIYM